MGTVAGILTPHVLHAGLRQRVVHGAATVDGGVLCPGADENHLVVLVCLRRVGGEQIGGTEAAERCDVPKQFRMAEADRRGVTAAHRVAHDRAVILVLDDAELFLDIRDHVVEHFLLHAPTARRNPSAETPATGTTTTWSITAFGRRGGGIPQGFLQRDDFGLLAGGTRLLMTEGHDDDRGNGLLLREEIVHDHFAHAGLRPAALVVVGAVQQVDHRIFLVAGVVAGRRVHDYTTGH